MIIALDCDGVLADFMSAVLALVNKHGKSYTLDDVKTFNMWSHFDLTPIQREFVRSVMGSRGFFESLEPYPGANDAVAKLQLHARVICVTSPWHDSPTFAYERRCWLKRHFDINSKDVVVCKDKTLVAADFLLDDCPDNVHPLGVYRGEAWLLDRPWNRSAPIYIPRQESLDSFVNYIEGVKK